MLLHHATRRACRARGSLIATPCRFAPNRLKSILHLGFVNAPASRHSPRLPGSWLTHYNPMSLRSKPLKINLAPGVRECSCITPLAAPAGLVAHSLQSHVASLQTA